jgi:hypothetical protein
VRGTLFDPELGGFIGTLPDRPWGYTVWGAVESLPPFEKGSAHLSQCNLGCFCHNNTAVYKLCKYINLEDNSIKDIQELQRRGRDKPIPNTPRQPWEPEESYFSLNSTNLWTKLDRNLRDNNLRCVLILPPSIFIGMAQGSLSWQLRGVTWNHHWEPMRKLHVQQVSRWSWLGFGQTTWFGQARLSSHQPQPW